MMGLGFDLWFNGSGVETVNSIGGEALQQVCGVFLLC
jgi:hypothetical protein